MLNRGGAVPVMERARKKTDHIGSYSLRNRPKETNFVSTGTQRPSRIKGARRTQEFSSPRMRSPQQRSLLRGESQGRTPAFRRNWLRQFGRWRDARATPMTIPIRAPMRISANRRASPSSCSSANWRASYTNGPETRRRDLGAVRP